jgi:hypothetical protein
VILSKKSDKKDAVMKDLFIIEDLSFLNKEKDDEPKSKRKTSGAKKRAKKDTGSAGA